MPRLIIILALICALPLLAAAGEVRPSVMNVLPPQPLAVVRAIGLGTEWQLLKESQFAEQFVDAATIDIAAGLQQMRNGLAQLQVNMGVNAEEMLANVIGTDCVLAIYGPGDGVFIAENPAPARLNDAAEKILTFERASGKIQAENAQTYKLVEVYQTTYTQRNPDKPPKMRFHCIVGNRLVAGSNLDTIERVIDRAAAENPPAVDGELAAAFVAMGDDAIIQSYIDTDAISQKFDVQAALQGKIRHPLSRFFIAKMKEGLPLLKYLAGTVTPKEDGTLEFRSSAFFDEQTWPETMKAMLPKTIGAPDVLQLAPDTSALSIGHQIDKAALWQYVMDTTSAINPHRAERMKNGANWIAGMIGGLTSDQLLAKLGDQVGVFITSRDDPEAVPVLSLAFEIKDAEAGEVLTAIRTLAGAAAGFAQMEAANTNTPAKAVLESSTHNGVAFTTLRLTEEKFAGNLNVTLFVLGNHVVVSTNIDGAKAIVDRHAAGKKDLAKAFNLPNVADPLGLAGKFDARLANQIVFRHKTFLVNDAVRKGKPREQAEKDVDNLIFLLGLIDRISFHSTYVPGRIDRVCTVSFSGEGERSSAATE